MIDLTVTGTDAMRLTNKLVAEEAMRRGWKAELYHPRGIHMRLTRPDGKSIEIFSAAPPTMSYVAASRANDKFATHVLLEERGFPVPETYTVGDDVGEVETAAGKLLSGGKQCVIKPLDAGHGHGITVGIDRLEAVAPAVRDALVFSKNLIVQEYIDKPVDVRVTCIDFKPIASVVRIPARVQGDGKHTTLELIDQTNASGERGEQYQRPLNVIPKDLARHYLGDAENSIPQEGEWVQVLGTANVGTGGETQNVTAELPEWLLDMAEQVARAADLPVCGVDFLVAAHPAPQLSQDELKPFIIELNKCPSLFLNEKPTHGEPVPVVGPYVDYLASL